jgi:SAM-dependent methyltransferase
MLDNFACPACGSQEWSPVETFIYRRTDRLGGRMFPVAVLWRRMKRTGYTLLLARPRRKPVTSRSVSRYQYLRRTVLFDVWFQGADMVTLTSVCCRECGFMAYSPRPTDQDVGAKYAYLKEMEPDIGGQTGYDPRALRSDLLRATRVYERCAPHLRADGTLRALDYGGGNGKLLQPLVAHGHSCYLVDYNDSPIPGVTKICDDMVGFSGDEVFDLILCSHVLEHASDLGSLVAFFRRRLDPSGLLYVEIPQEIWAGLRLEADPVTHINFFTRASLARLLLDNGFEILESRQQVATYGGATLEVLWVLARPAERGGVGASRSDKTRDGETTGEVGEPRRSPSKARPPLPVDLPAEVKALLYPSRKATLRRMYELSLRPRLKSPGSEKCNQA